MGRQYTVRLASLRGFNLACEAGQCHVFVSIKIGHRQVTTEVEHSDNNAPKFKEISAASFQWDGVSGMPSVEFTVWRRDELLRTNQFIGFARAQLHDRMLELPLKEQRVVLGKRGPQDNALINTFSTLGYIYFAIESVEHIENADAPSEFVAISGAATNVVEEPIPVPASEKSTPASHKASPKPYTTKSSTPPPTPKEAPKPAQSAPSPVDQPLIPRSKAPATHQAPTPAAAEAPAAPAPATQKPGEAAAAAAHSQPVEHPAKTAPQNDPPLKPVVAMQDAHKSEAESKAPDSPRNAWAERSVAQRITDEEGPRRKLHLDIQSAINLIGRDMGAPGDPFAVIVGLKTDGSSADLAQTDIKWTTNEPAWNKRFKLSSLDPDIYAIEVLIWDYDQVGDNDFLGRAVLPIDFNVPMTKASASVALVGREGEHEVEDRNFLLHERRNFFGELHYGYVMDPNGAPYIAQPHLPNAAKPIDTRPKPPTPVHRKDRNLDAPAKVEAAPPKPSPKDSEPFRARVRVTVLSAVGVPSDTLAYVSLAYGAPSTSSRQCVDNAASAIATGATGVVIFTYNADFNADAKTDPLVIELRDAKKDRRVASGSLTVNVLDTVKPQTLNLTLLGEAKDVSVTLTVIIASEILPCNVPSKLDPHSSLHVCVKKVHGLKTSVVDPFAFVITTYAVGEVEHEYRTPVAQCAEGSDGSIWYYYEPPVFELSATPDITFAVYTLDENGFDECVGVAMIPFARLTSAPDLTLPVLPRHVAGSSPHAQSAVVSGFINLSTRVLPPRTTAKGPQQYVDAAPTVVEVVVLQACDLIQAGNGLTVFRLTNSTNPSSTADLVSTPKAIDEARWDHEPLRFHSAGVPESIRFTFWDAASRGSSTFLGEYEAFLKLPGEPVVGQITTASLRPRQDVHFHEDDVRLMNSSPTALGIFQFAVRTFSVTEFEQKRRDEVAAAGGGYVLHLQIVEVSDTGKRANYSVSVKSGNDLQSTQAETSINPKFRSNMRFSLHYETEMLGVNLHQHFDNGATTSTVAEVSLPVSAPPHNGCSETFSSWIVMRRTSGDSHEQPKVHLKWRTVSRQVVDHSSQPRLPPAPVEAPTLAKTPQPNSSAAGSRRSRDTPISTTPIPTTTARGPETPPRTPDPTLAQLRDEIATLRLHLTSMKEAPPPQKREDHLNHAQEGRTHEKPLEPFSANIYSPSHASLITFRGTIASKGRDVLAYATSHFAVDDVKQWQLVRPNLVIEPDTPIAAVLHDGETIFFVQTESPEPPALAPASQQVLPKYTALQNYSAAVTPIQPPQFIHRPAEKTPTPPSARPPSQTSQTPRSAAPATALATVVARLREASTHQSPSKSSERLTVTSAIYVLRGVDVNSGAVETATGYILATSVNGFARNVAEGCEVFLQAPAAILASTLEGLAERMRLWLIRIPTLVINVEQAQGFIPVLQPGFRVFRNHEDAEAAFEKCSVPYPGAECWFYQASEFPFGTPHTRWVDERA